MAARRWKMIDQLSTVLGLTTHIIGVQWEKARVDMLISNVVNGLVDVALGSYPTWRLTRTRDGE